jgi:predicted ABC-type ATPase
MQIRDPNPKVIVIGGPNGAGKSTIARALVLGTFGIKKYVNADTIAQGLAAFHPQSVAFEAGRIMLTWINKLAEQREDFAFETTLASRTFIPKIEKWCRQEGYHFHLIFLWLRSPDLSVRRVAARVSAGGHHVPEQDIRRRYQRGICNFKPYQALADTWRLFDNSYEKPILIAERVGRLGNSEPILYNPERWQQFREAQDEC